LDPTDALVVRAWPKAGFAEHRRGRINGVDPLGDPREADRERSGSRPGVEDGPRLHKKGFKDLEDLGRVRLAVSVLAGDVRVFERPP
jgi:hypothetical protein